MEDSFTDIVLLLYPVYLVSSTVMLGKLVNVVYHILFICNVLPHLKKQQKNQMDDVQ